MSATLSMCQRTIACRPWASMSSSSFLITGCLQRAGKPLEQAVLLGGTSSSLFMHALCLLSDYGSDLLASSSLILSAFGMPNYMKLSRMFIFCLLAAPPWRLTHLPSLCNQSAILIQSEYDSSILTVDPGEVIYGFDAIHVQEVIDGRSILYPYPVLELVIEA